MSKKATDAESQPVVNAVDPVAEAHPDGLRANPDPSSSSALLGPSPDLELKYRTLLWLGHGHQGLYGDDGEMQCSECAPVWDYKRAPLEQVEEAANRAKLQRVAEVYKQHEEGSALLGPELRALIEAMYHDHVKYPQLRLPEMQAQRLGRMMALPSLRQPQIEEETKT